ncbi:MAG: type II toxin-antitoxin system VapC family toxin [Pseudomonadota bacterium]
MTQYLLDSNALLWSALDSERLSKRARALIESEETDIIASGVSLYELMFKARRGKLPSSVMNLPAAIEAGGYGRLSVSDQHLAAAAILDWDHGDPWDRILVAQANLEDMRLISIDKKLDEISNRRVW